MNVAMICETRIESSQQHSKSAVTDRSQLSCKITYVALSKILIEIFITQ
jgi:hypothetical protein